MSNGEAKRWWIDLRPHSNARAQGYSTRHSAWSRPIVRFGVNAVCVMPVEDHERIVAELETQVSEIRFELEAKQRPLSEQVLEQAQTIATQKRVIEKLIEQRNVYHTIATEWGATETPFETLEAQIAAIEKGEA